MWPDTAVHLDERVLPGVPIRHWICSLPWGLRALLGYDRELCAKVVSAFAGELMRSLRKRAKHELGLASVAQAHAGAVHRLLRKSGGASRLKPMSLRPPSCSTSPGLRRATPPPLRASASAASAPGSLRSG